ncbi:unnamed protein product [Moneuplotes crassus]|uniref:Histidine kinase domain-containing protein n=1 Tax=Euplotes crassus TaxID=5936 RepID=A0AAD1Y8D1_EUPCR|nr:unnamed protein product [Moneuplotes crassus]
MHVFIDTTDIINLEQAKSRIKLQKIMFASTSHEFRTPLNTIINSFNFIESSFEDLIKILTKKLPEDVFQSRRIDENVNSIFKFSKTGATSSTLLLALVEDVLNLSKIDNGTFVVSYEFFSIPALLCDVHSLFSMQCEQRKVDLITECNDDLKFCEIKTDRNRVMQVLLNLVSTSTKFTFSGFIKIKAALTKTLDGLNFLKLRVEDSGTGIKKEDQQNLFKQFGTLEENRDINPNGCGLGLTISKNYVERLGGEIRMKSVYGKETDMAFTVLDRYIKNLNSIVPAPLLIYYPPSSEPLRNHMLLNFQVNDKYFPFEAKINKCKNL